MHIAISNLTAITQDLKNTGSEVTSRCKTVTLCRKSNLVPLIGKKQEDIMENTEAEERKVPNKGTGILSNPQRKISEIISPSQSLYWDPLK